MAELAVRTKALDFHLEQVQDFTPTPMTLATEIYYTGIHPYTGRPVATATDADDKQRQRMFFFWYNPEYRRTITDTLRRIGRTDLIPRLFGDRPPHRYDSRPVPKHDSRPVPAYKARRQQPKRKK